MIGPVDSYQSIYVAACGQQFVNHRLGVEHERSCHACAADREIICATCNAGFKARDSVGSSCLLCQECWEEQCAASWWDVMSGGTNG